MSSTASSSLSTGNWRRSVGMRAAVRRRLCRLLPFILVHAHSALSFAQATLAPADPLARPTLAPSNVRVTASEQTGGAAAARRTVNSADVLSSAGTYGDFEKYLQILPGVVFNSDASDDVLVRGGNPVENLYLVDGFEVPNINHITGEGTTGGFTSMLDTSSIRSVTLESGGYSAAYAERLSSVISINTLDREVSAGRDGELEAGYVGFGGHKLLSFGSDSHLLLAAHHSLLDLVTDDIGLDGVPAYTNGLASGSFVLGPSDVLSVLSLSGQDSIQITPSNTNVVESNTIQTQFEGWRTTNGLRWRHAYRPSMVGVLTVSDSEQGESVAQQDQAFSAQQRFSDAAANPLTPVYSEHTHDGSSILEQQVLARLAPALSLDSGAQLRLNRIGYAVAQPVGQQSPFSADPGTSDASTFTARFASGQTGSWAELKADPTEGLSLAAGLRIQTFAAGGAHTTLTPRLRVGYRFGEHHSLHAAFGEYAQQPSFINLEAYPQNRALLPIHAQHLVFGAEVWKGERARVTLEAYRKHYWNYPVAAEYPQLSLANEVDTLGRQFIWLPLTSQGHGHTYGAELAAESRPGHGLVLQGNLAWARAFYSGTDGVFRPGNFDFPVVVNFAAIWRSPRRWEISTRYEYTTGRPYTPFLLPASFAQDRGIYDLARVNAVRGPAYSRLDFQLGRAFHPGRQDIHVFAGLENALDRQNFLANAWTPHCSRFARCAAENGAYTAVPQIGLYPNFGARAFF